MEQGQCWIQTKRKYSLSSNLVSYDDSWEEQAFAEDAAAAGSLGGCIWPPRSYSCSFCRREFRSAQALGGHMNVHRKDRARLKQPYSPHHNEIQGSLTTNTYLGYNNNLLYPSPVCELVYQTNPNSSDPDHFLASPSSPSDSKALLAYSVNGKSREETLFPFYNSSVLHRFSPLNSSESWPSLTGDQRLCASKLQPEIDNEKVSKKKDSRCRGKVGNDHSDIALALTHLVVCEAHKPVEFESTEEDNMNCKKRKTEASSQKKFSRTSSFDKDLMESKMFGFSPSSNEELDLELRLGTRSKV